MSESSSFHDENLSKQGRRRASHEKLELRRKRIEFDIRDILLSVAVFVIISHVIYSVYQTMRDEGRTINKKCILDIPGSLDAIFSSNISLATARRLFNEALESCSEPEKQ